MLGMMLGIVKTILRLALSLVNRVVPKDALGAVFYSHVPMSDNSRALFEHIRTYYPNFRCHWLTNDWTSALALQGRGVKAYPVRSLRGLGVFLQSKYVFTTHPFSWYSIKSGRQRTVCLWHGMPLKAMGFLDRTEAGAFRSIKMWVQATDIMTCTSTTMKNALATSFAFPDPRRIIITGQPRNDKLVRSEQGRTLVEAALGRSIGQYHSLIAYLPTIKRGYENRVEGQLPLLEWNEEETLQVAEFLKRHRALLIVKFHPLDEPTYLTKEVVLPDNVAVLTASQIVNAGTDLYELLGAFDALVTDYSSVYFDYLLLNRPIAFMVPDLHKYDDIRGFALEPVDFWMPGPKVTSIDQLIEELGKLLGDREYWRNERELVSRIVNAYQDARSCERVCEAVLGPPTSLPEADAFK